MSKAGTFFRLHLLRDPFTVAVRDWFRDKGDETLRVEYPLQEESVVFDVGGYRGDWAKQIIDRYNPLMYIFEPVPEYFEGLRKRFISYPQVQTFNFGLSDRSGKERISVHEDGSSIFHDEEGTADAEFLDIATFLEQENIPGIDLIKINIEGGEYALLKRMIETGIIRKCRDIQVQFHEFIPDAKILRSALREKLSESHRLTYDYPFVWENWRRKE